jgi:hypothetical protein
MSFSTFVTKRRSSKGLFYLCTNGSQMQPWSSPSCWGSSWPRCGRSSSLQLSPGWCSGSFGCEEGAR